MNKNDVVRITIEDMSHEGAGIGHVDGMTVFVKDAVKGDEADVIITKVKKNYCFGTVKEVVVPSKDRVIPKCPVYRQCGGCQIMQLSYEAQLALKTDIVKNNLIRLGGFEADYVESVMEPIIGMDEDDARYRNKAQIPVGKDRDDKLVAGFYGARSHRIVPVRDCKICSEASFSIAYQVLEYMEEYHIPAYDETTGKGLIRHVLVREGKATGETMVCLVVNGADIEKKETLVKRLREYDSNITSIVININTRRDNVILGYETKTIYGKDSIRDSITLSTGDTIAFDISANSFYQVNHDQMEKLYSKALEYAGLTGQESVWDLYCGIGTITLSMATNAKQVYGVEVVPQAIENARANAALNHIDNVEFFCGEAEVVLPEFYDKAYSQSNATDMITPDVIVVDPPRKGCDNRCLDTMLQMKPGRIVYVSCDSATLARDLKYLCQGGYTVEKVTPVDQFANTMHIETVVLLSRKAPV
ncbi:MAG: 23S rRNA (uracil(1939)-C(5))-methyltransferase RlmD [Pseudobutyrivibrio sp.]|nr:23S rRNA (uracil(1939)-C(5))-methyltransferase RlmD [Pseudobutyrivibrio sp.]